MGPPAAVSEWLSFDKRRGLIEFDVEINGLPARAALDTGATGSVLDPEFAAKAGIAMAGRKHVTVEGVSGEKRMSTAEDFTVAFVGSRGAEGAVPVQDAVILERSIGVDVLLGL